MLRSLALLLLGVVALVSAQGPTQPCCFPSGACKVVSYEYCHYGGGQSPLPMMPVNAAPAHGYYPYCAEEIASLCPGACCYPDHCTWTSEHECDGAYRGNGTSCDYDCAGACCMDGMCSRVDQSDCDGTFHSIGTHCLPDGECPRTNWILGAGLLFAALLFVSALAMCCFVCYRNRR